MIKKLLLLLLVSLSVHAESLTKTIDGDTFGSTYSVAGMKPLNVRVYGIDTPEKGWRAKCPEEALLAKSATEFANKIIFKDSNEVTFEPHGTDKYGRILVDIYVNGSSYKDIMIEQGYAKEYYGKGPKFNWCKK